MIHEIDRALVMAATCFTARGRQKWLASGAGSGNNFFGVYVVCAISLLVTVDRPRGNRAFDHNSMRPSRALERDTTAGFSLESINMR